VQYWPFEEYVDHGAGLDITFQNARPSPWCLYSQGVTNPKTFFPPNGNCFPFVADEWMTFQVHIHTGPLLLDTDGNYVYRDSHVDLWVGRDGQPSEQVLNFGPFGIHSANFSTGMPFSKVWLLPYHTSKDPSQVTAEGYTWYDELIISTQLIAEPSSPTTPPLNIKVSGSGTTKFGSGAVMKYGGSKQ